MPPWVVAEDPLQVATWRAEATRQVDVDYDREVQMVKDRANQDRRLLHFVKEREASVTDPRRPPLTFPEPPSFASKGTKLSYKEDEHSILSRAEHTLRVMVGKRAAPPEALPILQTCIDNVRVCLGDMMGIKQPASPLPLLPKDTTGMCQSEGPLSLSGQDMKDRKACIRRNGPSRRETMRRCLSATCTRVHLSVQKGMPQGQIEEERQVLRHLLAAYEGGLARNLGSHQLQLGMLYQTERIKELQEDMSLAGRHQYALANEMVQSYQIALDAPVPPQEPLAPGEAAGAVLDAISAAQEQARLAGLQSRWATRPWGPQGCYDQPQS